jgi:hypothetical protein
MSPDQRSDRQAATIVACLDCGGPVVVGRWRCDPCRAAAEIACRQRQPGQSVLPSQIPRIRETMA